MDEIEVAELTGLVVSYRAAGDLVDALDALADLASQRGAALPLRWRDLRRDIAFHIRAGARADASTRVALEAMPQAEGALVDTAIAAKDLGLTEDSVRWHCRRGVFRTVAIRRGGRWWIPVDAIAAEFVARQSER